jgi:hypothetical protein
VGESIPVASQALLARYLTDVAADSGKSSNVFAVDRQYYDRTGFANYRQTFNAARQVIVDRQPYPQRDTTQCPDVAAAYPTCISAGQIQSELQRLITTDGLPAAGPRGAAELSPNAPIYLVIVPGDVNVCYLLATRCLSTTSCSYHAYFIDAGGDPVLYAVIGNLIDAFYHGVAWPKVCQYDGGTRAQEPNGNEEDLVLTHLSHELSETITDPINNVSGWFNTSTGNEDADNCNGYGPFNPARDLNPNAFAPTLGGGATAGTLYDQLINDHRYYTQSEWSNGDSNCAMRPSAGRIAPRFVVRGRHRADASLRFNPAISTSTNPLSSATWNFGDGSRPAFFSGRAAATRVRHRYRRAGRYTITLTLVDNHGNLKSTTRRITVDRR